uniref:hypothetical protein n=1 Tax=Caulacanthus ustulatus TaxID=31411 RepID=UPI0027DA81A7|nr:hypothetical protein REQ00_pgp171 [Caulacanthus ustulatus]WCH57254.1 hypothetical protein [Caulacanthus ustulatus]
MLKIYLICLASFLFPICFLITLEIYKTLKNHIIINYTKNSFDNNNLLHLAQAYIKQNKWLKCITILENNIEVEDKVIIKCYNGLGFCYYHIEEYGLSEYYYKKILKQEPYNISTLFKLANVYSLSKDSKNARNIYQKVLELDKDNTIARKALNKLS